jgi:copper(I)-binding protein
MISRHPAPFIGLVALACAAASSAGAHGYKRKSIEVVHPWTSEKADADGRQALVGMKMKNASAEPDRLVRAESAVAERVELRAADESVLTSGIAVPGSGAIDLKRGTVHVQLVGLRKTLIPYDTLPVTLVLEKAGRISIDVLVEEAAK